MQSRTLDDGLAVERSWVWNSVPSTHIGDSEQLSNFISEAFDTLFWPPSVPAHKCMYAHTSLTHHYL